MVETQTSEKVTLPYTAFITDRVTGETREFKADWTGTREEFFDHLNFFWTEHNYACDCNRAQLFGEVTDEWDHETDDQPCNTGDNRWWVRVVLEDGTVIVDETPPVP